MISHWPELNGSVRLSHCRVVTVSGFFQIWFRPAMIHVVWLRKVHTWHNVFELLCNCMILFIFPFLSRMLLLIRNISAIWTADIANTCIAALFWFLSKQWLLRQDHVLLICLYVSLSVRNRNTTNKYCTCTSVPYMNYHVWPIMSDDLA